MGFSKKFPPNYKWLGFNNQTQLDKRFTAKQLEILLMFYTEEEIIELCDRWFIVIEHTEFGLITYNELLHKRLAHIDDIISTKIDEIDMENSTEQIRRDMNNMWRIFVNAHFTKLLKELHDYGFPKSSITYKELFQRKEQIDLRFAFLENVHFFGAVLLGIRFEGSYISNSIFKYCMFSKSNFAGVECCSCSFESTQFAKVNFGYSECTNGNFSHTRFMNVSCEHSKLSETSFVLSHISKVNFNYAECGSIDLKGAKIKSVNLKNANFDNAVFGYSEFYEKNKHPQRVWTSLQSITYNFNTSLKNTDIMSVSGNAARALIKVQNRNGEKLTESVSFLRRSFNFFNDSLDRLNNAIPTVAKGIIGYFIAYVLIIESFYGYKIYHFDKLNISNWYTKLVTFLYIPVSYIKGIPAYFNISSSYIEVDSLYILVVYFVLFLFIKTNYSYSNINKDLKRIFWTKGV